MPWQRLVVHRCAYPEGRSAAWHSMPGHLASRMQWKQTVPACVGKVHALLGCIYSKSCQEPWTPSWVSLDINGTSTHPPPTDEYAQGSCLSSMTMLWLVHNHTRLFSAAIKRMYAASMFQRVAEHEHHNADLSGRLVWLSDICCSWVACQVTQPMCVHVLVGPHDELVDACAVSLAPSVHLCHLAHARHLPRLAL